MIDTVRLYAGQDFKVSDECQLTVKPANHIPATGETGKEFPLYRFRDQLINGQSAFLNDELVRVDINRNGLIVQTEVPKWFSEKTSNFQPVSNSEFSEFRNSLKKRLEGIGINFDFDNAKLSRVDLFKNGEMRKPLSSYFNILSRLDGGKARMKVFDYGAEGVTFGNTQRGACFYDKRLQLEQKGFPVANIPNNILRGEIRFHRSGSVQKNLGGITTFRELQGNFDILNEIYKKQLMGLVFRLGEGKQQELKLIESQDAIMRKMINASKRGVIDRWVGATGAPALLNEFGSISKMRKFISQYFPKGTVSKAMKEINFLLRVKMESGEVATNDSLYSELVETFCKNVA